MVWRRDGLFDAYYPLPRCNWSGVEEVWRTLPLAASLACVVLSISFGTARGLVLSTFQAVHFLAKV